jgi:hypothetical protein
MKYAFVLLVIGCLVAAVAQQWQVELVDSSCSPSGIFVKRDSARTYVAYVSGEGSIRFASMDTTWSYEDVDTGLVRPLYDPHNQFHFALGPEGRMAVSGVDDSFRPVVIERSDSVWSTIWTRERLDMCPLARAVFGADSLPAILYCSNSFWSADFIAETWQDSVWHVDSAEHFDPPSNYDCQLYLYDADCSADAEPCYLATWSYSFPLGKVPPSNYVLKGYRTAGGWNDVWLGGGFQSSVAAYDIVAGGMAIASAAVYSNGYTTFDHDTVCAGRVTDAAVQVDSAGRELIAYVTSDGALRFAYKDTRWHYREVPGVTAATCCDLALDDYGQPMIAFEDAGGLWLAHGQDMLGAKETPSAELRTPNRGPTIVSGASGVKRLESCAVFDAMGRRVHDPRPGVYFVRRASSIERQASGVTKVVIMK